jgi:hypothetical protein
MMSSGPTLRRLYLPGLDFLKVRCSVHHMTLTQQQQQQHSDKLRHWGFKGGSAVLLLQ